MQILELSKIAEFKCDGSQCDSKCCKNWMIDIDDKTFSKYKHIKPKAKSNEITKHIKNKSNTVQGIKNIVALTEEKACPFLGEDKLCFIQKTYGENYLSKTCKTYPRLNFMASDGFVFRALTLTCPLACKLLLNIPRDSGFHTFDMSFHDDINYVDMKNYNKGNMLPLINVTNYNILRYQNISLDQRLAIIALFAERANYAKNLKELSDASELFERELLPNAIKLLEPLNFDPENFIKEMLNFVKVLFTEEGNIETAKIYTKFINETFEISVLEDESFDYDKLKRIYEEKYLPAKKELFEINDLQIENYAINYLFMTGLPVKSDIKHFPSTISKYILEYKMSEFIFVCFYASIKENWHEVAIELAAEDIAACFEHNINVKKAIDEKFKDVDGVVPTIRLYLDV